MTTPTPADCKQSRGPGSRQHRGAGDLRGAIETCLELNRRHPDHARGWYLASFLMKKTGRVRDAMEAIGRALRLDPLPVYRLHRAQCLVQLGDRRRRRGRGGRPEGCALR